MLKTIKLYGVLAKKFGKQFKFDVANTREAMRALSTQVPGFENFMLHAHEHGLTFAVWQDKDNIDAKQLDLNTDASVIKVVPKVIGAGGNSGLLSTILGAVLIVGGIFTGGLSSALGVALIGAGVAPEQARMVLPQGMQTQWIWTGSLFGWANLYNQRSSEHAQYEANLFAEEVNKIMSALFPISWAALTNQ